MTTSTTETPAPAAFSTVLVANRGEIACRVISTLRTMGIRSVAVYSDADAGARHVAMADVAVRIGPAAAAASYLNTEAILAAVKATGAQAVHPGYGFLSENEGFARALAGAGVTFIGPGVDALNMMGDKIRSKNHVRTHDVPVVPGIAEPGLTDAQLLAAADGVGYPLLIKPSAGGGGKGMHVVERAEDLAATLVTARRVAASAFGDDTLFLERLIATPRHIEVQVLADNHGNVIHLGERECSLQRRHQKVIEEAPSSLLDAATRARIGEAACNAARSVGYSGAGTVEFLVSAAAPDEFFFMEMNTRLQVEHPVTEMVTGLDLVQWQVRIAAGEKLSIAQQDVLLTGHAVEARVYAENPERGFLPTSGTVLALAEPSGDGIRVDSSLTAGLQISSNYDPMLSKVIAWGPDRTQALARLDRALAETTVLGLGTNIEYLRLLVTDEDVRAGRLDTTMIERKLPALTFRRPDSALLAAAALHVHAQQLQAPGRSDPAGSSRQDGPWQAANGWRLGLPRPVRYVFALSAGESVTVQLSNIELDPATAGGQLSAEVVIVAEPAEPGSGDSPNDSAGSNPGDGAQPDAPEAVRASFRPPSGETGARIEYDGVTRTIQLATGGASLWIGEEGFSTELRLRSRAEQLAAVLAGLAREEGTVDPEVRSPMPGTVVSVSVASGDAVEPGQTLLAVEAMKMEHQLLANVAGTVHLSVRSGDLVKADQVVATIHPAVPDPASAADTQAMTDAAEPAGTPAAKHTEGETGNA
ncbi:ATP-grasp domain-containing protein [Paenarthrobacter sp. Z7-10]|uniref:ATP-binding protein n=1 Tax=Paenarthrobacter sp. Z7-10 TaxID=2787635 RepID=UPI0022A9D96E|nr:biotin carboxylase N-terminal domain-containing protein [Paenarthrobacter sp. Z7-10]MCZ2402495.1 ATP-grasp domain-containing protein [Paenarthrobacter sp. Z7-10]